MKPRSRILEFYKNNLDRFEHYRTLPDVFEERIEKILQGSPNAFPELERLCQRNEEVMFGILQGFLTLHFTRNIPKAKSKKKNLKRDIENYIERLAGEMLDHIQKAKSLDLNIDRSKLIEKSKAWLSNKAKLYLYEMHEYDDAVNFVCMIDPSIDRSKLEKRINNSIRSKVERGEPLISFNDFLHSIYLTCERRTTLSANAIYTSMSNLLNSLGIQSDQGKTFTRENIRGIIGRSSQS
ncbi:MAG: hypothetical protein JRJ41_02685 [Deltaproteobacteria bacterium]|nr:hypothetical protein [Deltaproteobacteria bacterium]